MTKKPSNNATPLFGMTSPQDLLDKAENDFLELKESVNDPYKAFNFFVTIEHMPDWLELPDKKKLKEGHPVLAVVSHIANGNKHYFLSSNHKSVTGTSSESYCDEDYFEEDFVADTLVVQLTTEAAEALGFKDSQTTIDVVELARRALAFWQSYDHPLLEHRTSTSG